MVLVDVELARCTGCAHCRDVCPVAVFDLQPRDRFPDLIQRRRGRGEVSVSGGKIDRGEWSGMHCLRSVPLRV